VALDQKEIEFSRESNKSQSATPARGTNNTRVVDINPLDKSPHPRLEAA